MHNRIALLGSLWLVGATVTIYGPWIVHGRYMRHFWARAFHSHYKTLCGSLSASDVVSVQHQSYSPRRGDGEQTPPSLRQVT